MLRPNILKLEVNATIDMATEIHHTLGELQLSFGKTAPSYSATASRMASSTSGNDGALLCSFSLSLDSSKPLNWIGKRHLSVSLTSVSFPSVSKSSKASSSSLSGSTSRAACACLK